MFMENSPQSGEGAAEESKELNTEPGLKKNKKRVGRLLKLAGRMILVIRTQVTQKHKTFGMDHEPGAF